MSKIQRISIEHFKAITKLDADLRGCTAIITGANDSGKSSFLRGLPDRIRGERPELIVKRGEKNGSASMSLTTGERFEWVFDEDGKDRLTFFTKEGFKTAVTKEIARKFFPSLFDIDEFLAAQPKDKSKMIQKLVGIDFTQIDQAYKNAYDERTLINRRLSEQKARLTHFDPKLPTELIDTSALEQELGSVAAHNQLYETKIEENTAAAKRFSDLEKFIVDGAKRADARINELEKQIKLEKQREADERKKFEAEKKSLNARKESLETWLDDEQNQPKDAEELRLKVTEAKLSNGKITANIEAKKAHDRFTEIEQEAKDAETEVKKIEAKKQAMIARAEFPDGITIDDDGVKIDGLPLEKNQISTSKLYITALKLAVRNLGEVKTVYFDASPLDKKNLSEVEKWAKSQDLQLLIERPSWDDEGIKYELVECVGE